MYQQFQQHPEGKEKKTIFSRVRFTSLETRCFCHHSGLQEIVLHKVQQRGLLKKYFTQKWKLCQHFLSFMCFQTHLIITVEHKRCYIKGDYLKNILAIFFNVMKVRVCQVSHAIACVEQTLQIFVHSWEKWIMSHIFSVSERSVNNDF